MQFKNLVCGGAIIVLATPAWAQTTLDSPTGEYRPYQLESGVQANPGVRHAVVFNDTVRLKGAAWLRLYFSDVQLEAGSFVRVRSLLDGETQLLDGGAMAMWGNTTAYFNGDAVTVELIAAPGTTGNRFAVNRVAMEIGHAQPVGFCGICGIDDRQPSNVEWSARLLPAGCTASIWNEESCIMSAGHCVGGQEVIQFRVPPSNPDCSLNNPPVSDQFPIIQKLFNNNGVGDDWSVMSTGTNDLGETAYERYGELRVPTSSVAEVGNLVGVWGYAIDNDCELSQTQQTSLGEITSVESDHYTYSVDTTPGRASFM